MIDGVQVTLQDHDLPPFARGQELFLFFEYNKGDGKYRLLAVISGAFSVDHGVIRPLVHHPIYDLVEGLTIEQFGSTIRRLSR